MTVAVSNQDLILQKIRQLPPLPMVVRKLIATMQDERSSAESVCAVLSTDQALASQVLKLVNSSFYGLSGQVSTISRAVVVLGFGTIRNLATGLGVGGIIAKTGKGLAQQRFWSHAVAAAAAAEVLARSTEYPDPEEAFVAGLLHDIGHLVLATAVPKEFAQVLALGPRDMLENETRLIGMTHARAGQKVLQHWKLPARLAEAVRMHHNPQVAGSGENPLTSLVMVADVLACVVGKSCEQPVGAEALVTLAKAARVDLRQTRSFLQETTGQIARTRQFIQISLDGEAEATRSETQRKLQVVLLGTDPIKAAWVKGVSEHHGHAFVAMADFFALAREGRSADVILIDPAGCSDEQLRRMKPLLTANSRRCAVLGAAAERVDLPALGLSLPVVPLAFSSAELSALAG